MLVAKGPLPSLIVSGVSRQVSSTSLVERYLTELGICPGDLVRSSTMALDFMGEKHGDHDGHPLMSIWAEAPNLNWEQGRAGVCQRLQKARLVFFNGIGAEENLKPNLDLVQEVLLLSGGQYQ